MDLENDQGMNAFDLISLMKIIIFYFLYRPYSFGLGKRARFNDDDDEYSDNDSQPAIDALSQWQMLPLNRFDGK